MTKLFALTRLLKTGRLAFRLMRDGRVPFYAKLVMAAAVFYALSPLDFVPDMIPVLGQLDDVAVLAAGLQFFIKLCPEEIVEEHETALGQRPSRTVEGSAQPVTPRAPGSDWRSV